MTWSIVVAFFIFYLSFCMLDTLDLIPETVHNGLLHRRGLRLSRWMAVLHLNISSIVFVCQRPPWFSKQSRYTLTCAVPNICRSRHPLSDATLSERRHCTGMGTALGSPKKTTPRWVLTSHNSEFKTLIADWLIKSKFKNILVSYRVFLIYCRVGDCI